MSTTTRLAAFALLLAVMVGSGALLGRAVGPIDVGGSTDRHHDVGHATP